MTHKFDYIKNVAKVVPAYINIVIFLNQCIRK